MRRPEALASGQGESYIYYSFSANVVELEVGTQTGETRVLRFFSGHDAGRVVTTARGRSRAASATRSWKMQDVGRPEPPPRHLAQRRYWITIVPFVRLPVVL